MIPVCTNITPALRYCCCAFGASPVCCLFCFTLSLSLPFSRLPPSRARALHDPIAASRRAAPNHALLPDHAAPCTLHCFQNRSCKKLAASSASPSSEFLPKESNQEIVRLTASTTSVLFSFSPGPLSLLLSALLLSFFLFSASLCRLSCRPTLRLELQIPRPQLDISLAGTSHASHILHPILSFPFLSGAVAPITPPFSIELSLLCISLPSALPLFSTHSSSLSLAYPGFTSSFFFSYPSSSFFN